MRFRRFSGFCGRLLSLRQGEDSERFGVSFLNAVLQDMQQLRGFFYIFFKGVGGGGGGDRRNKAAPFFRF